MKELLEDVFVQTVIEIRWHDKPEIEGYMGGAHIWVYDDVSFHERGRRAYLTHEQYSQFITWAERHYKIELEVA